MLFNGERSIVGRCRGSTCRSVLSMPAPTCSARRQGDYRICFTGQIVGPVFA